MLTQEELAKELHISIMTVNRWETGKTAPTLRNIKSLKDFCQKHGYSFDDVEREWMDS